MKKFFISIIFIFVFLFGASQARAYQFDLLVLPTDLFNVCDNYFCFPEASNIIAGDSIANFARYKGINVQGLDYVREKLNNNYSLQTKMKSVLTQFAQNEKIDFPVLKEISGSSPSAAIISSFNSL